MDREAVNGLTQTTELSCAHAQLEPFGKHAASIQVIFESYVEFMHLEFSDT